MGEGRGVRNVSVRGERQWKWQNGGERERRERWGNQRRNDVEKSGETKGDKGESFTFLQVGSLLVNS